MTTIAMSAGIVPAALALGDGGEFRAPMAIAVMGGLLVADPSCRCCSCPPFFAIMDDVRISTGKLISRFLNPNAPDEPDASPDAEIAVIHPRGPLREAANKPFQALRAAASCQAEWIASVTISTAPQASVRLVGVSAKMIQIQIGASPVSSR